MRKHMSLEECLEKYPKLAYAMQQAACLTATEAGACLRDWRNGDPYSGEAVNHFGGCKEVILAGIRYQRSCGSGSHGHSLTRWCVIKARKRLRWKHGEYVGEVFVTAVTLDRVHTMGGTVNA